MIDLEIRIAHLEQTLETLDTVIIQMRDETERQAAEIEVLRDLYSSAASTVNPDRQQEPPPPHY